MVNSRLSEINIKIKTRMAWNFTLLFNMSEKNGKYLIRWFKILNRIYEHREKGLLGWRPVTELPLLSQRATVQ